jgi:hypothetical protein
MQFITVSNGETSTGIVLTNGDFMAVQPGGQAVSTTVIGPNFTILSVQHGGVAIASLIEGPATSIEEVDYGASDQGSIVGSGGLLEIADGGAQGLVRRRCQRRDGLVPQCGDGAEGGICQQSHRQ